LKTGLFICCNSRCLEYNFRHLLSLVSHYKEIEAKSNNTIIQGTKQQIHEVIRFVTKQYQPTFLYGTELSAVFTCNNVNDGELLAVAKQRLRK
jgi:hypothetical protein